MKSLAKVERERDFPGSPVVKILHFHWRGHRFNPWFGNWDLSMLREANYKKKAKSYSLLHLSSQPDYLSQSPLQSSVSVTDLGSKEWVQIMSTTSGLSSILFAHQVDARAQGNERRAVLMLFTIPRTWKQPGCPLTDEGIKKLWCIYTMEYYSAIRRNAFESVLMR